jgi:hypothetical protein
MRAKQLLERWSRINEKVSAEDETEKINVNKKKPENMKRHEFKAAEWTHPNGHPRCIRCGQEERTGGYCDPKSE